MALSFGTNSTQYLPEQFVVPIIHRSVFSHGSIKICANKILDADYDCAPTPA